MTKKEQMRLAQVLRDERDHINYELVHSQGLAVTEAGGKRKEWASIVESIAFVLQSDNPRFNTTRFYNACGYSK